MNPRNTAKADTYILAWKAVLHGKQLDRITKQRQFRQEAILQTQAIIRGLKK